MRGDPHNKQKVNVKRLRKFKDFSDVSAPSADEETELEVAQREVEALANEIRNLQERRKIIEITHNIESGRRLENRDNENLPQLDDATWNTMFVGCGVVSISLEDI